MNIQRVIRIFLLLLLCHSAFAVDPPGIVNYQGTILVDGSPFEGTGDFKFALINGTGTETFWTHDNTNTGTPGSEPTTTVEVDVSGGRYSVPLGDTSFHVNMTIAIDTSIFTTNADVRLRVWFDDGTNGIQQLSPDQRLTSVSYALSSDTAQIAISALSVPNATITSAMLMDGSVTSSKIGNKAVGNTQLATNAVQSTNLADGAVTANKIANGAVGSDQLAPGAVDYNDLANTPQSGKISTSTLDFYFNQADYSVVFPVPFTSNPVVTQSVSDSTFPLDVYAQVISTSTTEFEGSVLDGAPTVSSIAGNSAGPSLAVVDGNPAVSFYLLGIDRDLIYKRAFTSSGSSWSSGIEVVVDSDIGFVLNEDGRTSLAIVNGNPAIAYYDASTETLNYARATNTLGFAFSAPIEVDNSADVGKTPSLVVVNGNPAICYFDETNDNLKFVRATDADGTSWGAPVNLDNSAVVGKHCSMAIVDGNPAISYFDDTNDDLKYIRASNVDGSSWGAPIVVDNGVVFAGSTSLVVVDGKPAIAYWRSGTQFVRSTDAAGTTWDSPVTTTSSGGNSVMAIVDGNPAIAFNYEGNKIGYVYALDAVGSDWTRLINLRESSLGTSWPSLTEVSGKAFISFADVETSSLNVVRETGFGGGETIHWIAFP